MLYPLFTFCRALQGSPLFLWALYLMLSPHCLHLHFAIVNYLLLSLLSTLLYFNLAPIHQVCPVFLLPAAHHLFSCESFFFCPCQMGVCTLLCRQWEVMPAPSVVHLAHRNSWRRRTFGCWVSRRRGVTQELQYKGWDKCIWRWWVLLSVNQLSL